MSWKHLEFLDELLKFFRHVLFVLVIVLAVLLVWSCDQHSPVEPGQSPVGVWHISDDSYVSFGGGEDALDERPMNIWEFMEDGTFMGVSADHEMCSASGGEWQVRGSKIWITLYPDSELSLVFRG